MEALHLVCADCLVRVRTSRPESPGLRDCPNCGEPMVDVEEFGILRRKPAPPEQGRSMRVILPSLVLGTAAAIILNLGPFGAGLRLLAASDIPSPYDSTASIVMLSPPTRIDTGVSHSLAIEPTPVPVAADDPFSPPERPAPARPATKSASKTSRPKSEIPPPRPTPEPSVAETPPPPPAQKIDATRLMVRDRHGRPVVARVHGKPSAKPAVMLPDGQIGWPDGLIPTDQPFVPATAEQIEMEMREEFPGFKTRRAGHYVLVYQASEHFTEASLQVLEKLYERLTSVLERRSFPIQQPEFPLVAVIFRTERDFRAHKQVAPEVQAYYDILSNRIFFYEEATRAGNAPEIARLRKPQTVAHEGTHQILQNIGVHPRLSDWPPWVIEGFAEFCSSPKLLPDGRTDWAGIGQVNPLHVATLRELDDPASTLLSPRDQPTNFTRNRNETLIHYLVTRSELNPTDYALSWALTYFLANDREKEFTAYLRKLSQFAPFEKHTPEEHLADFKSVFGENLGKLSSTMNVSLNKKFRRVATLPYFAVIYEQATPAGLMRRAMVSQSMSMIEQWVDTVTNPRGTAPQWQPIPHPTRAQAVLYAQQWMNSR